LNPPSTVLALILILHFALGAALVAAGDRVNRRGFALAMIAPLSTVAWLAPRLGDIVSDVDGGKTYSQAISWVPGLDLAIDFRVDAFSSVMLLLISGIGLAVCTYALGYFSAPKAGVGALSGLLTMFAGAMTGLVVSDHLLALFIFWELTSVTSYALIGNDDRNPKARDAALQAVLITGAGGLAMLAGLVIIGQSAGTFRLSELAEVFATEPPSGALLSVATVLVLLGAFTKSAQWPFSGWLPGAMVAPTPISTYLHAATMVKAGVYLVARLAPLLYVLPLWRPLLFTVGSATMVFGGWRALRQVDLKVLLAYGTVSQLGFLMMLFGAGTYDLAQAATVLILAHGAFKAALFMVVGIIDHQAHTRDVRRLASFGPGWGVVRVVTVVAAASMAGVPPMLGFIGKEKALLASAEGYFGGAVVITAVMVIGSILTFAYSGRFVMGVFGRLVDRTAVDAEHPLVDGGVQKPSTLFVAPAVVLATLSFVTGLVPVIIDGLVSAATVALHPDSHPKAVVLWAGVNIALWLSMAIIIIGLTLVLTHRQVTRFQATLHRPLVHLPTAERSFWVLVSGTLRYAKRVTRVVQNGSLPVYLMVTFGVASVTLLVPVISVVDGSSPLVDSWLHVPVMGIVVAAAIGAAVVRRRIASALMLGAVGYGMAGFYVIQGAPDLALTQFAIETLATVLFVLVLRVLPRQFEDRAPAVTGSVRLIVSAMVGLGVFVFALGASQGRADVEDAAISVEMLERSVPDGKGSNVVNVILVDFRGLDTLGEITVLLVAGLGVVALARTARRATLPPTVVRSPVVDASVRLLFASIAVLSIYFLFAGHNQPGGGFVGGLTAGAAVSLVFVAGGLESVRDLLPTRPWVVLGVGLAIAVVTALIPILLGGAVLEHAVFEVDVWMIGVLKATSALPFDIGVYLVVVGLVLMAYEAFGEDVVADADLESVEVSP
jgi:multicomponent Na+:H+ antiporter subunit A